MGVDVALVADGPALVGAPMKPEPIRWWEAAGFVVIALEAAALLLAASPWGRR